MSEQIDDPQTLRGLFPPDSDDDSESTGSSSSINNNKCYYEVQSLVLVNQTVKIRQYDYHSHNANRIWPGTFPLAEYLLQQVTDDDNDLKTKSFCNQINNMMDGNTHTATAPLATTKRYRNHWGRVLELGTATGLLSIRLLMEKSQQEKDRSCVMEFGSNDCCYTSIVTSDVDDSGGAISKNLHYNYLLNHINPPHSCHIPHTWGTGWHNSVQKALCDTATGCSTPVASNTNAIIQDNQEPNDSSIDGQQQNQRLLLSQQQPFDTIIASDILLYVSSYPALVQTLCELMIPVTLTTSSIPHRRTTTTKFVMSWNRRLKNDKHQEFFALMVDKGFVNEHHGKGVYTFVYNQ